MIDVVNPKVGETIYDGTMDQLILVEAYNHLTEKNNLSATQLQTLKTRLYGKKTPLAYLLGYNL